MYIMCLNVINFERRYFNLTDPEYQVSFREGLFRLTIKNLEVHKFKCERVLYQGIILDFGRIFVLFQYASAAYNSQELHHFSDFN